jgi:hypothetical protein
MNITEVKKWAKAKDYEVKNKNGGYEYKHKDEKDFKFAEDIKNLVRCLFNKMTNNAYVEHQMNWEKL